jgi:hypothetical protein
MKETSNVHVFTERQTVSVPTHGVVTISYEDALQIYKLTTAQVDEDTRHQNACLARSILRELIRPIVVPSINATKDEVEFAHEFVSKIRHDK